MARMKKGITGGLSGSIGPVVASSWKGIDYLRAQSSKNKKKRSTAQLMQRAKFALAANFMSNLNDLLTISFQDFAVGMTARNHATSYTIHNAVYGEYPNLQLDYSEILIARGNRLPNARPDMP